MSADEPETICDEWDRLDFERAREIDDNVDHDQATKMAFNKLVSRLGTEPEETDVEVDDGTIPVDVIVEYLEDHSPVDYEVMGLVETADDGGRAQNTPTDGPYPFIHPSVDYTAGEAYCETSMIPRGNTFLEEARNQTR